MSGVAKASSPSSKRPYRMVVGRNTLADLRDGGAVHGYPGDYPGRQYFVNNITGSSGNDGLSWEKPFAEPSQAITAWEAYRALFTSTNQYIRGQIFIQGTGTAYSALTALGSYCDIIGIGAHPRGDGTGVVVIKGTGADGAAGEAGGNRGLFISNIQFAVSGAFWAMDIVKMFRSEITNCTFMGSTANSAAVFSGGFRVTSHFGGNYIHNNFFGATNGIYAGNVGFEITTSGVSANNCLYEYNTFLGVVHGMKIHAGVNDNGSIIRHNLMHSYLGTTEPTTAGLQMGAESIAYDNFIVGADAITEATEIQTIFNKVQAGGASVWEDTGP